MQEQSRNLWAWTLPLLLLLAALTLPRLNNEGLWVDEGWTAAFSAGDSPASVVSELKEDRHPPLYFMSLWAWRQVAGDSELALRVLSVFALLLGATWLYQWSRVLFGGLAALLALLLLVLADKLLDFGIEARHYTWLMLWAMASNALLLRYLGFRGGRYHPQWAGGRGGLLGYALMLLAGFYTHLFMGMVLLVQAVYALGLLLWMQRQQPRSHSSPPPLRLLRHLALAWMGVALAFLPWLPVILYQFDKGGGIRHAVPFEWAFLRLLPAQYLGDPLALFVGLLLLATFAPLLPLNFRPQWRALLLPLLGLMLPLGLMLVLRFASSEADFFTERNLSILIPPAAVLMGLGLRTFYPFARWGLVLVLLANGLLTTHSHQYQVVNGEVLPAPAGVNPPWRAISRALAPQVMPGGLVLSEIGGDDVVLDYHLQQEISVPYRHVSLTQLGAAGEADPLALLRFQVLEGLRGFWYVDWSANPVFVESLPSWGYVRTASYATEHFGSRIDYYRYDSLLLLEENVAQFEEGIVLHQWAAPAQHSIGQPLVVGLWWSSSSEIATDYTMSVFLLNDGGQLVAQHDGMPQHNQAPTSTWTPGTLLYDPHRLAIPAGLAPGNYRLAVKLYQGGTILPTTQGEEFAVVGSVELR